MDEAVVLLIVALSCSWAGWASAVELPNPQEDPERFPPPGVVAEAPGFHVQHGVECVESEDGADASHRGGATLPAFADRATVFLNGWWLQFLDKDQKVMRFSTYIENVQRRGFELTWQAHGRIHDSGHDNPFRWCYTRTVVAWRSNSFHGMSDLSGGMSNVAAEGDRGLTLVQSWFTTALHDALPLRSFLARGFEFRRDPDDDKILQIALNLRSADNWTDPDTRYGDQSAPPPPIDAGPGNLSWISEAVLRDDDAAKCWGFGLICTTGDYAVRHHSDVIGGKDIGVIQPPRFLLPVEPLGSFSGCIELADPAAGKIRTQEVVVENVPFVHAVPMLSSWSLAYWCPGDEHVRAAAVWLGRFSYERRSASELPSDSFGRLRYTIHSIMTDDGGDEGVSFGHRVHVLGFGPLEPTAPIVVDPNR